MKYNFTVSQIEATKNFVKELHEANTIVGTTSRIEHIKLFKDAQDSLYLSYECTFYGADGTSLDIFYIKINEQGERQILNYTHDNLLELAEKFSKLEPITL